MGMDNRRLIAVLAVLVVIVLIGSGLGGAMMGPGMMWGFGQRGAFPWAGAWGLGMAVGFLAILAFWGALIVGVVLLVRWLGGATVPVSPGGADPALEVLRRRYAAGEITREEYEQMRRDLER